MKGKVLTPWLCAVLALIMVVGMALPAVQLKAQAAVSDTIDPGETYYYDLADGEYYVVGGGVDPNVAGTSLTVNGAAFTSGNTLSKPGDYTIVNRYQDREGNWVELTQQIVLYQRGDAHADGKYNVLDLVAMKRHEQGITLPSKAGQMAVEAYVDKADASVMRDFLLTDQGEAALKELEEALPDTTGLTFNSGSNNVMPIGGYEGPADKTNATDNNGAMKDYLTDEIYGWVKDAGINLILSSGNQTSTPEITTQKYLSLAEKYDMRAFVGPSYLFSDVSEGGGVTATNLEQLLREYSGYSSMAGFTLQDEPDGAVYPTKNRDDTKDVEESQELAKMLSAYPNLTGFTNLFPYWEELGSEAQFEAYLEEYFAEYGDGADHLCFDYYVFSEGIETGGRSKAEYFKNLAIVKKVADKHGVPFWSTIQAGNYVTGKKQNTGFLSSGDKAYMTQGLTSWNVNTSLAYGAKGITYYPLIQPYSYSVVTGTFGTQKEPNYNRNGIIGANGEKTDHYAFVQKANQQIAAVDEVLMNATHKGFMASGTAATDSGVTNITGNALTGAASNKSAGVFVGCFDYYGKSAYYVVNYDYSNSADITLTFDKDYALSVTVDAALNSATTSGNAYTLTLTAGNAALVLVNGEAGTVDNTAVDSAIAAIDAIPAAPDATGYYEAVVAARTAYNALNKAQKAQISDEKLNVFNAHLEKTRSYETVAAMIDALPNTVTISVFNDIDKANAAYEALGEWSVLVSAAQKTKLENRLQTRLGTTTLIDAATGRLDNPSTDKGYTVGTESDTDYNTVFTMDFTGEADGGFRLHGNLSGYTNRHFFIYNPTGADVSAWMYDGNWSALQVTANGTTSNLLTIKPGWNKVELPDDAVITSNFLGQLNASGDKLKGIWKISSVYAVTDAAQAQQEAAPVNALIAELPDDTAAITAGNYTTYQTKVAEIRSQYNSLGDLAKTYVDLTKVEACEERIAAVEAALGDQVKIEAVESLIDALPEATNLTIKHFKAVDEAAKAYDALGTELQAQMNSAKAEKLIACRTLRGYYTVVYDAAESDAKMAYTGDAGIPAGSEADYYAISKADNDIYGKVYTLNIKQSAPGLYDGFYISQDGALTAGSTLMFWIFNPTDHNVSAWFNQNWGNDMTAKADDNLEPGWNRVVLQGIIDTQQRIDVRIYNQKAVGEWLITSFYSVTQEAIDREIAKENGEKAANVDALITALPEANAVQLTDKDRIVAARDAYEALTDTQKALVKAENVTKLTACEAKITELETPADKVTPVNEAIANLPEATALMVADKEAVRAAETAYNALTDDEKAQVTNAAKLNNCIAKVDYWDELAAKTVLDATNAVVTAAPTWGAITTNVDDNTFGKVMTFGDATALAVTSTSNRSENYKTSRAIGFYIYNPTDTAVEGDINGWIHFQLQPNAWNYVEYFDAADRVLIDTDDTIYINGSFTGIGWKLSSFYRQLGDEAPTSADVEDATIVKDASGEYVLGSNYALSTNVDDSIFGKVISVDATSGDYFAVDSRNDVFKAGKNIVFYIYNPTNTTVTGCNYTLDWQYYVYFQLEPGWNRIHFADLGAAANKQMISSDAVLYFYPKITADGWKISSFYSLPDPTTVGTAAPVDPEAEAIAAVIAQITALPEAGTLTLDNKDAVTAAQRAYDALSENGKAQVENAAKLTECTAKIAALEADAAAAAAVNSKIAALPEATALTVADKEAVRAAETDYNALSDNAKTQVTDAIKLNACIAKVTYWDKLDSKTVLSAASSWLSTSAGAATVADDNMFGKVFSVPSDATYFVAEGGQLTTEAWKASQTIGFYVYNPTDSNVTGNYCTSWCAGGIDNNNFTLRAKAWTWIEFTDFESHEHNDFITGEATIYFYANMAGSGWRVSSFYNEYVELPNLERTVLKDATVGEQLYVWTNAVGEGGATVTSETDATYNNVFAINYDTGVTVTNVCFNPSVNMSSYDYLEFSVYNPGSESIRCRVQEAGANYAIYTNVYLDANAWTTVRVTCSDFATTNIQFYIDGEVGNTYKVSPIVGVNDPNDN